MRVFLVGAGVVALTAIFLIGRRVGEQERRPAAPKHAGPAAKTPVAPETEKPNAGITTRPTPRPHRSSIRGRLSDFTPGAIEKLEQEWEARLIEDPGFAEELFAAFLEETDPMKMSFLQTVIASNPKLRNSPYWQDRFMTVAERDADPKRRITALLFVQQAESISSVRDRLYTLAETNRDLTQYVLVTLKGLPDRRSSDPRLAEFANRIFDTEADPELRGLALRISGDQQRAARAVRDPEKVVRTQAYQVITSRETLQQALASEVDPEARQLIEVRLSRTK